MWERNEALHTSEGKYAGPNCVCAWGLILGAGEVPGMGRSRPNRSGKSKRASVPTDHLKIPDADMETLQIRVLESAKSPERRSFFFFLGGEGKDSLRES